MRYAVMAENDDTYLCHCRMCQNATAGFAAFVQAAIKPSLGKESLTGIKALRSRISRSARHAGRRWALPILNDTKGMVITFGSSDNPSGFVPIAHAGTQGIHKAWLDTAALSRQTSFETESVSSRRKGAGVEVLA